MTENPAETLRRAAKLMRERAGAATPGPWEHPLDYDVTHGYHVRGDKHVATRVANCDAGDGGIGDEEAAGNANYIASMHPMVGLAAADWLDHTATLIGDNAARFGSTQASGLALITARVYLGEAQS